MYDVSLSSLTVHTCLFWSEFSVLIFELDGGFRIRVCVSLWVR